MRTLPTLLCLLCISISNAQEVWIQTSIRDSVLSIDGDGQYLWVATEADGLKKYDPTDGTFVKIDSRGTIIQTEDFRVVRCANGKIYAGTLTDGLYILDSNGIAHYSTENSGLPGNTIKDILYDPEDAGIWLATNGGLTKFVDESWVVYDSIADGINGTYINCLHQSTDGTLWIGTRYNGITKFKDGIAENFNYLNSGINDNFIRDIIEDPYGMLYVVNNVGINTYEIATDYWLFVYTLYTAPLSSDRINQIGFDAAETLWIVSHNGITRADSANVWTQFYTSNSNIPHNTTDALYIDPSGRVYVGSYGGLIYYDIPQSSEANSEFSLYPIPAQTTCTIAFRQEMGKSPHIYIYNNTGKLMQYYVGNNWIEATAYYTLNLSALSPGAYFICVEQETQTNCQELIIVR